MSEQGASSLKCLNVLWSRGSAIKMREHGSNDGPKSHRSILWAAGALRHRPVDELLGGLDRAALAMHAILRVDLQAHLAVLIGQVLVHSGWAEPPLWAIILRQGHLQRH